MLIPVFLPLGSMKAVVLMAEGATCGKDGRRLCLPTSVLLIASPTSTGNVYVPFWASMKEQKDYMLSLIHISEPTRLILLSRMPSSA